MRIKQEEDSLFKLKKSLTTLSKEKYGLSDYYIPLPVKTQK